jgi:DNA-binding MarR family transcriptional regulator
LHAQPLQSTINLPSPKRYFQVPPRSSVAEQKVFQEIGQLMPLVRRVLWSAANRRLETFWETMLAWRVLACVKRAGPAAQRELADAVAQDPAVVCRLLDDLEERGLVHRVRDVEDRRRMMVRLTPAGRRRWQALLPEVVRAVGLALEPLSGAEQRTLRDLLRKLVDEWNGAARRSR